METNKGSDSFPGLTADHPVATGSIRVHCRPSLQPPVGLLRKDFGVVPSLSHYSRTKGNLTEDDFLLGAVWLLEKVS